ncbi:MAG: hypothetical protein NT007_02785 [Candidatus Kapabacteria bacterium]|nr:hypothetical protein [Candidatus Kapabacteria bacterium]
MSYMQDEIGTWQKNFKIHDHLGNVRSIVQKTATVPLITAQYDYAPFGSLLKSFY